MTTFNVTYDTVSGTSTSTANTLYCPNVLTTNAITTNSSLTNTLIYAVPGGPTNSFCMATKNELIQLTVPSGNSVIIIIGETGNISSTTNTQTWINKTILTTGSNVIDTDTIIGEPIPAITPVVGDVIRTGWSGSLLPTSYYPLVNNIWYFASYYPLGTTLTGPIGYEARPFTLQALQLGDDSVIQQNTTTIRFATIGTYEIKIIGQYSSTGNGRLVFRKTDTTSPLYSINGGGMETKTLHIHGTIQTTVANTDYELAGYYPTSVAGNAGFPANATGSQEMYNMIFIRRLI